MVMAPEERKKHHPKSERTKLSIFNAAVELLGETDFEDITIRDIVRRANVSGGTFYNYYATKMEVFYETYQVADQYFNETVAPLLDQPTAYERVLCFFEHYAHYSSELTNMKMTRLLYNPDNPWFNRDPDGGMVGVLIQVLQDGLDSGEFSGHGDSARELADYLMICVRGLIYNWCTEKGGYDLYAATRKLVERLMAALRP